MDVPALAHAATTIAAAIRVMLLVTRGIVSGGPAIRMEARLRARHVHERLRGTEAHREAPVERVDAAEDLVHAERVHISERPTAERREPEPEDRADVAVAR